MIFVQAIIYIMSRFSIFASLLMASVIVSSCGYNGNDFKKDISVFCQDGKVTDAEFTVLSNRIKMDGAVYGFSFSDGQETVSICSDDDLVEYLHSKGIDGTAKALESVSNVGFYRFAVYMESSASMKGYSAPNGNPYFTASVLSLFNAMPANADLSIAYVGAGVRDDAQITLVPKKQYESQLTSGNVVIGTSSPLDKILETIIDSTSVETISCLITDGILSGSNAEISANREFTKTYLPLLEDRIRNAVRKASEKGLGFTIYRLVSTFNGTYYDYKNAHHRLQGVTRPYFVIVIGHPANLEIFNTSICKESGFKPTHSLSTYNMQTVNTVTRGQIIKTPGSPAYSIKPVNSTLIFKPVPQVPVTFKYRVNLNNLPRHYRNLTIIKNSIKLTYQDSKTGIIVDKSEFIQDIELQDADLNNYDVVIELTPDFIRSCPANLQMDLSLEGYVDDWYKVLSSSDDTNIDSSLDQNTFALESLVGGIINGVEVGPLSKPIDCQINIEK